MMADAGRWRTLATAVLLLAVVVAVGRLARMWMASSYGLDFSDEGYYLVWIDNPFAYKESATQFGFFYHPLYEFLGRDLVRLRHANILITYGLAWCLGLAFFRMPGLLPDPGPRRNYWRFAALACVLATSYPHLFDMWLPTPSYNSLAMQAALLIATGFLLTAKAFSLPTALGAVLVGVGGWMAFLAKPTTAAAFGLLTLLFWRLSDRFNWRSAAVALAVACALLAASAIAIDGSLAGFYWRLSQALESAKQMGIQPSIGRLLRVDLFKFGAWDWGAIVVLTGSFVLCFFSLDERRARWHLPALGLLLWLTALGLALAFGLFQPTIDHAKFRGLMILTVPMAAVIAALLLVRTRWANDFMWPRPALAVMVTFALAPHAYALGTGNNYWQSASAMSIFWVFAGLAALVPTLGQGAIWLRLLPLALGTQVVSLFLTQMALTHPYRQPQVSAINAQSLTPFAGAPGLVLETRYANYVEAMRRAARGAGFRPGTPVVDLTGHSPGSLYLLGAKTVGSPWLLGGYPGSDKSAASVLSRVDCAEVAAAWLLVEPSGPRHLSPSVLQSSGIQVPADYVTTGRFFTPDGFGDYPAGAEQQLLRPARPLADATRACLAARRGGS